ncbi:hypothetical protein V5F49_05040 [Xanthobacter sp. V3C-3]
MSEDEQLNNTESLAALFERAADLSRKPIVFDADETTDDETEN